jgi:hypothetical protein
METIAVYCEEQVKVYGITHTFNVNYQQLCFPLSNLSYAGNFLASLEVTGAVKRFEFITCQQTTDAVQLHLFTRTSEKSLSFNEDDAPSSKAHSFEVLGCGQTDLIFLHGPHFQDRYGILDVAVQALSSFDLLPVVTGCAGTSMYLAFKAGSGSAAEKVLRKTFLTPTSV